MNRIHTTLIFLLFIVQTNILIAKSILVTPLKRIDVLNVGSIAYPSSLEERSDIPFRLLVDKEFKKLIGDSVDLEKIRPTLIFLEKDFTAPSEEGEKVTFGYISVAALSGKYSFPQEISDIQKAKIETSFKQDVNANLNGTQFQIKKWNPFEYKNINGLVSIQYSYEQWLGGKDKMNVITTNLYDSDLQLQIILSAPSKEYKKWQAYYNQILTTFKRKINIGDIAIFEYSTEIRDRKDIPFKYLVDKEFKNVLGDSVDYEQLRPGLLFLKKDFTILDTTNIQPFGSISFNILPEYNANILTKDSLNLEILEKNIKNNIQQNLDSTNYRINKWNEFRVIELDGLPAIQYSYEQQLMDEEKSEVHSTYIFDKLAQIQINMSSPISMLPDWKKYYEEVLESCQRLVKIPNVGTIYYPVNLEERSDIPFKMLVDTESKKKLGDSIDYERFRPSLLFLQKNFNEHDTLMLNSFGSITINLQEGDFNKLSHPDSINISIEMMEQEMKAFVERSLKNTNYSFVSWDSFTSYQKNGCHIISYSYTQKLERGEPKHICVTYFYTSRMQTQLILTASQHEYTFWKSEYDRMVESFRLQGWR